MGLGERVHPSAPMTTLRRLTRYSVLIYSRKFLSDIFNRRARDASPYPAVTAKKRIFSLLQYENEKYLEPNGMNFGVKFLRNVSLGKKTPKDEKKSSKGHTKRLFCQKSYTVCLLHAFRELPTNRDFLLSSFIKIINFCQFTMKIFHQNSMFTKLHSTGI